MFNTKPPPTIDRRAIVRETLRFGRRQVLRTLLLGGIAISLPASSGLLRPVPSRPPFLTVRFCRSVAADTSSSAPCHPETAVRIPRGSILRCRTITDEAADTVAFELANRRRLSGIPRASFRLV